MAKTIKFNLILDGKPVRTIEELQENFCINDIASLYENGMLQRWLKARGFDEYLQKINNITSKTAILDIIKIFGISGKGDDIKEAVFDLHYQKKREEEMIRWENRNNNIKEIVSAYHAGYEKLKTDMKVNYANMPFIKSAVKELCKNYFELFKLDYKNFFYSLTNNECLIVYALLMNEHTRPILLTENEAIVENITTLYVKIPTDIEETVGKYFKIHKGTTEGYWKDLETNQKVMVLSIYNSLVGSIKDRKEELSTKSINGKFVILDGLLFKSIGTTGQVIYMEV